MPYRWWEKQLDGSLKELELKGEKIDDDSPLIQLLVSKAAATTPQTPRAPDLSATQPTQTTVVLTWAEVAFPGPPITGWEVERQSSTDNGTTFSNWASISGSPFVSTLLTKTDTVPSANPEIVFNYRTRGVNSDGVGEWSTIFGIQWDGEVINAPNRPTGLIVSNIKATSVDLSWTEAVGASTDGADQHAIYEGNTLLVGNLSPGIVSYPWSGLTANTLYSNINIRRHNSAGWSTGSNWEDFTTATGSGSFTFAPLIGCSNSAYNHGGTDAWDAWRVYNFGACVTIANRPAPDHPKVLCVTDSGNSQSEGAIVTNYDTSYNNWSDWLERFYYTQGTAAEIARRQDVELHIANGNEYGDKVTSGNLTGFIAGCQGIYDATRIKNTNGTRRYPLASAWLDPTHDQAGNTIYDNEDNGSRISTGLDVSLFRAVPYLDGIAWSMYPPGRKDTVSSPTLDWPIFDPDHCLDDTLSIQTRNRRSYLMRCFLLTSMAQDPATNSYITTSKKLKIATWETGIGDFPLSQSIRPYFAVHGMLASMGVCAKHFGLEMSVMLWWDSMTDNDPVNPQNKLQDEPTPGPGQISTRVALQNWKSYNHFEGDSHPTDWPEDPPNTWPNRDDVWKDKWVTDMNAAWPL